MDVIGQYHAAVTAMLQKIADTQREAIGKAAGRLADAIAQDRYIYVIGTGGHSYIASEEMFWRAGGLVPIYPILDPGLSLADASRLASRQPRRLFADLGGGVAPGERAELVVLREGPPLTVVATIVEGEVVYQRT